MYCPLSKIICSDMPTTACIVHFGFTFRDEIPSCSEKLINTNFQIMKADSDSNILTVYKMHVVQDAFKNDKLLEPDLCRSSLMSVHVCIGWLVMYRASHVNVLLNFKLIKQMFWSLSLLCKNHYAPSERFAPRLNFASMALHSRSVCWVFEIESWRSCSTSNFAVLISAWNDVTSDRRGESMKIISTLRINFGTTERKIENEKYNLSAHMICRDRSRRHWERWRNLCAFLRLKSFF